MAPMFIHRSIRTRTSGKETSWRFIIELVLSKWNNPPFTSYTYLRQYRVKPVTCFSFVAWQEHLYTLWYSTLLFDFLKELQGYMMVDMLRQLVALVLVVAMATAPGVLATSSHVDMPGISSESAVETVSSPSGASASCCAASGNLDMPCGCCSHPPSSGENDTEAGNFCHSTHDGRNETDHPCCGSDEDNACDCSQCASVQVVAQSLGILSSNSILITTHGSDRIHADDNSDCPLLAHQRNPYRPPIFPLS